MAKLSRIRAIEVVFERREDGGLRVHSDDVPGFVLSHSDPNAVFNDVAPALEVMLSAELSAPVTVEPLSRLREKLEDNGVLPIYTQGKRTYVACLAE